MVRSLFKNEFVEIFVDIPIEIAEIRDPKGLYKKAVKVSFQISQELIVHEKPEKPEVRVRTDIETLDTIVNRLIKKF